MNGCYAGKLIDRLFIRLRSSGRTSKRRILVKVTNVKKSGVSSETLFINSLISLWSSFYPFTFFFPFCFYKRNNSYLMSHEGRIRLVNPTFSRESMLQFGQASFYGNHIWPRHSPFPYNLFIVVNDVYKICMKWNNLYEKFKTYE